mmetsp:Transcript_11704/g.15281  ORF Transcript_11704/g.15281 Transcript_11704/m.15281 type:complete len:172 (+) Transcript_11704:154-669(+)
MTSLDKKLGALQNIKEAFSCIRCELTPFLESLKNRRHRNSNEQGATHLKADSEIDIAICLALGTLRFMAAKLRGCQISKDDPIRLELNHMRKCLKNIKKGSATNSTTLEKENPSQQNESSTKKRKDTPKHKRKLNNGARKQNINATQNKNANKRRLTDSIDSLKRLKKDTK